MNHSLMTADRGTHIRMLMVSLAGALIFIVALVGSEVTTSSTLTRLDGPAVVKAGAPTAVTSRDAGRTIR